MTPHTPLCATLTGVLFVGGLSRRMGTDKATLDFVGEALWAKQIRLLRELKPDVIQISARTRPAWCPPDVEAIIDEPPSCGPLSGLAAALRQLKTSHLLALAVDLPQMRAESLRRLWSLAQPGCGVVPVCGERFEPLCAIYPVEAAPFAGAALSSGDFSLQRFLQVLQREKLVQLVPLDESQRRFYQNANTPADLLCCQ